MEWKSNRILDYCNWESKTILNQLKKFDFPYLRGPKIRPLGLRMLREM